MDKDVDDQPGTATLGFPAYFPLPYRVPLIVAFGVFLFGTNLTLLIRAGIDVEGLFYPSSTATSIATRRQDSLTRPVYSIALVLLAISVLGTAAFWTITTGSTTSTFDVRWLPGILFLAFLAILISPVRLYSTERYRFIGVLRRVLVGGIDTTDRFLDVIVADILTSYAKIFGDIVTTICLFWSPSATSYVIAKERCSKNIMVPLAMAAPYAMRLRQCLTEYRRTGSRNHLANALKYCTAFPVILVSTVQLRRTAFDAVTYSDALLSDGQLYQIWIMACLLNSIYAFWWDVTRDWDLTLLTRSSKSVSQHSRTGSEYVTHDLKHPGLRTNLTFSATVYYVAIVLDLVLRMLWSFKLSPHLHNLVEYESGVFAVECLEVIRRWMWIFLRVECEHHRVHSSEGSIALTDLGGVAFSNGLVGKLDQD